MVPTTEEPRVQLHMVTRSRLKNTLFLPYNSPPYQVGGLCKSSNLKKGEEMDPKLIDRSLLFNFQPSQTTDRNKDTSELTNMRWGK